MQLQPTTFWPLTLGSGLGLAALAVYVWTRRSAAGGYALFAILVSISYLFLFGTLEARSATLAEHVFWQHVQIPGYAVLPVFCLLLTVRYTMHPVRGWWAAALFVVPVAGILLHWTNDWHHLYWSRTWIDRSSQAPIMGRTYGVGFWICVAYSYLIAGSSVFMLLKFLARNRARRMRTFVFLGAILLPTVASLIYVFEWFPVRYLDLTPYALTLTGLCIVWVIFRYRFQGIVPVAARSVVDSMADGVIVLDLDGRFADLNPALRPCWAAARSNLWGVMLLRRFGIARTWHCTAKAPARWLATQCCTPKVRSGSVRLAPPTSCGETAVSAG